MMDTDTATEVQVVTVTPPQSQPQPLEQALFGAGTRVRERRTVEDLRVTIEFDDAAFKRALEAVQPQWQLAEAILATYRQAAQTIAMACGLTLHLLSVPSVAEYLTDCYAPAAWCTPSRRPVTGRCRCALDSDWEGEEGGE